MRKKRVNDLLKKHLEIAIRTAKKNKSEKTIKKVFSAVDIATKKNIIHKNKAARVKSSLAKIIKPATPRKKFTK